MTTRTLADYRPQHDDDCAWRYCAVCTNGTTYRACKVAGDDHGVRRPCSCGLDALLAVSSEPEPEGSWPADCPQRYFVQGAQWWQFHANGATAFGSERDEMEAEAVRRFGVPCSAVVPAGETPCPQCATTEAEAFKAGWEAGAVSAQAWVPSNAPDRCDDALAAYRAQKGK